MQLLLYKAETKLTRLNYPLSIIILYIYNMKTKFSNHYLILFLSKLKKKS